MPWACPALPMHGGSDTLRSSDPWLVIGSPELPMMFSAAPENSAFGRREGRGSNLACGLGWLTHRPSTGPREKLQALDSHAGLSPTHTKYGAIHAQTPLSLRFRDGYAHGPNAAWAPKHSSRCTNGFLANKRASRDPCEQPFCLQHVAVAWSSRGWVQYRGEEGGSRPTILNPMADVMQHQQRTQC